MSTKIRTYRNTELFAAKLLTDLLDSTITQTVNHVDFYLASWHMQIVLDSAKDEIAIQDWDIHKKEWRKVLTLAFNRQNGGVELKIDTTLGGINTRMQKLILFLMLHVSHNGRNFFL